MKFSIKLTICAFLLGSNVLFAQSNSIEWSINLGGSDTDFVTQKKCVTQRMTHLSKKFLS